MMSNRDMIIMALVLLGVWMVCRRMQEGFAMTPYYNKWDVLSQDVFSLDRRIDAVPDASFVNQFEDSRHATCVAPDDWRLWQYCRKY